MMTRNTFHKLCFVNARKIKILQETIAALHKIIDVAEVAQWTSADFNGGIDFDENEWRLADAVEGYWCAIEDALDGLGTAQTLLEKQLEIERHKTKRLDEIESAIYLA